MSSPRRNPSRAGATGRPIRPPEPVNLSLQHGSGEDRDSGRRGLGAVPGVLKVIDKARAIKAAYKVFEYEMKDAQNGAFD